MKVGKGNFRPPPQVESSVVRMSPRDPPPPVAFEEFDGLNRIIFGRANKVCRANFGAKGVKDMLERNYRTWCAENGKVSFGPKSSRLSLLARAVRRNVVVHVGKAISADESSRSDEMG